MTFHTEPKHRELLFCFCLKNYSYSEILKREALLPKSTHFIEVIRYEATRNHTKSRESAPLSLGSDAALSRPCQDTCTRVVTVRADPLLQGPSATAGAYHLEEDGQSGSHVDGPQAIFEA